MVLEQVFGQRKDFLQRGVAVFSGEPVEVRVGDADGAEVAADALDVLCGGPRAARRNWPSQDGGKTGLRGRLSRLFADR